MKSLEINLKRDECDLPIRWMMRYGRGESHSPKKLLDDNGGESHSSRIMESPFKTETMHRNI